MKKPVVISLTALLLLVLISTLTMLWIFFFPVVRGDEEDSFTVRIKRGMSFQGILNLMLSEGVIGNGKRIEIVSGIMGYRNKIKAGKYEISGGLSSYALLKKLVEGQVVKELVIVPEGKTAKQIAAILMKKIEIDSTRFLHLVGDSNYVKQLGIPASSLEGFLFPNTYNLQWGMTEEQAIQIMVNVFKKQFNDSLRSQAEQMEWSIFEAVTLASIIEGESVLDSEREIISAVYHNRLKKGMRLQADPTIQYIIEDGPRRLLNADLKIDSPYNTYLYPGLPPGPINNPGLASIKASLNPAKVDYLYFVANGDGSHTFSRTIGEHLKAKAKFDRYRRWVKQMEKRGGENGEEGGSK